MSHPQPHQYFAQRLLNINADLLPQLSAQAGHIGTRAVAASTGTLSEFAGLMGELQALTARPVAIMIDEHNEIYKFRMETNSFFRHFTISTGYLAGVRAVSMVVASDFIPFVASHVRHSLRLSSLQIRTDSAIVAERLGAAYSSA